MRKVAAWTGLGTNGRSDPRPPCTPRYGHGRPPHLRLKRIIGASRDTYRSEISAILRYKDDLLSIPLRSSEPTEPYWLNRWQLGLDIASLYAYVRSRRPSRYIEVGSGISTMVAAKAKVDGALDTRIMSIDPEPREEIDALCDEVIRRPLEDLDLRTFDDLRPNDIVFFDGSHRVHTNSDTVAFYLDVLPALNDGVVVGIHDILWPLDYLPEWSDYAFDEQYVFAAYLLADCAWMRPLLACHYVSGDHELRAVLSELWNNERLLGVDPRGFAFWLTIARPERSHAP